MHGMNMKMFYGVLWYYSLSSAKLLLDSEYDTFRKMNLDKTVGIHKNNLYSKGLMNTAVVAGYPLHIPHP
jgi:hypothetical protein